MKKLTQEQINKILENHKHWLNEDCEGWENMRADFSYCELAHTDLSNTDLRCADLRCANLRCAILRDSDLRNSDLSHTNLSHTNLSHTDLSNTDLRCANLRCAILRCAILRDSDLSHTNLSHTNLSHTNLSHTDLSYTDLSYTDLSYINLCGADLHGAKGVPYVPMVCPEEGDFIGWKKADDKIVKLHIPQDALRSSATTRKCRCNKAEVIAIYNLDGTEAGETTCHSDYDSSFIYEVGKTVEVTDFDEDRWNECAKGIHFFINRQEAINY